MAKVKDEFRNVTTGWIGVVTIDGRGDSQGIPVAPGQSVWLSEEEQIATANAPQSDADNPFTNGTLAIVAKGSEVKNRRPFGADVAPSLDQVVPETVEAIEEAEVIVPAPPVEETGATPIPESEPETGTPAPGEEVATPEAAAKPPRRRKAAATA